MIDRLVARRALAGAVAVAAVALAAPSCAGVLDVEADEYSEVVHELCACDVAGLGDACFERLSARFKARGASAYSDLVAAFGEHHCGECENAAACFYRAPACSDGDCLRTEECCGYADKSRICKREPGSSVGTCSTCTKVGAACKTDDECCAGTGHGKCLGVGPSKFCVETCDPSDPTNCPGCCQHVAGAIAGKEQSMDLCVDATPGFTCRPTCNGVTDKASCQQPTKCVGEPLALPVGGFTVYGCQ